MIVFHAGFYNRRSFLWGEMPAGPEGFLSRRGVQKRLQYDAGTRELPAALKKAGLSFTADKRHTKSMIAWLPTMDNTAAASSPLIAGPHESRAKTIIAPWMVTALQLTSEQAVEILCACVGKKTLAGRRPCASRGRSWRGSNFFRVWRK
ncbi:MAG: Helicase, family [Dehalococcoidia bacterium]|nr:Helicase, family [Dehalococcoidia bacterium]